MNVCSNGTGHMTKVAAMPIYGHMTHGGFTNLLNDNLYRKLSAVKKKNRVSAYIWTEICEIRQIFKGYLIKFC